MVAEGEGRKDAATHRLSGRGPDNRLVHFTPVDRDGRRSTYARATWSTVEITYAAPHHLVADGPVLACAAPAPATPGRPAPRPQPPGSRSACPRSASRAAPDAPAAADAAR